MSVPPAPFAFPDFALYDAKGRLWQKKDLLGHWSALYFYPKDDTPGCTQQACELQQLMAQAEKEGLRVLGVSADDSDAHSQFSQNWGLSFPLLCDTQKQLCQALDLWKEKNFYGKKSMGIVRTTFLMDPAGYITWCERRVKVEGHAQRLWQAFHAAKQGAV
jgi:peroxiredoxin Q/BCP